jgi:GNAT superfamily N-acetyltransferase
MMDKEYIELSESNFEELAKLQILYKYEIGEEPPSQNQLKSLAQAIRKKQIHFYGCCCYGELIGCCSVCITFSTFDYNKAGVFEDFFIKPEFRHRGIARELVQFAYRESGARSLTVGCANSDLEMYKSLGFSIVLGNMLAFE